MRFSAEGNVEILCVKAVELKISTRAAVGGMPRNGAAVPRDGDIAIRMTIGRGVAALHAARAEQAIESVDRKNRQKLRWERECQTGRCRLAFFPRSGVGSKCKLGHSRQRGVEGRGHVVEIGHLDAVGFLPLGELVVGGFCHASSCFLRPAIRARFVSSRPAGGGRWCMIQFFV